MRSQLIQESLRLEGQIFLIYRRLDRTGNIYEFGRLKKELNEKQERFEQYRLILNELNKQEAIKKAKRRMMK